MNKMLLAVFIGAATGTTFGAFAQTLERPTADELLTKIREVFAL